MKPSLIRMLTLALALCLVLSLCLPALAESEPSLSPSEEAVPMDVQLEQAAKTVKAQLGLDTDLYSTFYGDYNDQPGGIYWYLTWSNGIDELSVTLQGCTILSYYANSYGSDYHRPQFYGFDTILPTYTLAQAQDAAQAFLDKVLNPGETVRWDAKSLYLGLPSYDFQGTLLKSGLSTPITVSITLDGSLNVSYYSRSDSYDTFLGDVDAPEAAVVKAAEVAEALQTTVDLEPLWVLTDDGTAQLAYVPQYNNFAVDAITGELTDLDALYENLDPWTSGYGNYAYATEAAVAEEAAEGEIQLSEAEQAAVETMKGVLPVETLDAQVRSIAAFGISDDAYCKASYDTAPLVGEVTCSLRYNCPISEEHPYGSDPEELAQYLEAGQVPYYVLTVTVDAMTGALVDVQGWSYLSYDEDARLSDDALAAAAQDFLTSYGPEAFREMQLYEADSESFVYAQFHEGYFFLNNNLSVSLNPVTGTITGLYYYPLEEEVTFGSSADPISLDQAVQAYMNAGTVALCYVAWPVAVDAGDPIMASYAAYGYNYIERLALVYELDFPEQEIQWIDANTGEVVYYPVEEQTHYTYNDLDGCYGKEIIETLASFGVGFQSSSFRPTDTITQRDLMLLLLNAQLGYSIDDWSDDLLQEEAVWYGFLTNTASWNPDKVLTRMEVLRTILNASEYGKAAALSGAYDCSFNDESGIRPADYGYASIGQALGIIHGTPEGYFSAYSNCTRQDAAIMLYNYLNR